jgi:hypothetical protein
LGVRRVRVRDLRHTIRKVAKDPFLNAMVLAMRRAGGLLNKDEKETLQGGWGGKEKMRAMAGEMKDR